MTIKETKLETILKLIPAEPGLFFLTLWKEGNAFEIEKSPVVAWVLTEDTVVGGSVMLQPVIYDNHSGETLTQEHWDVARFDGAGMALGIFSHGEGPSARTLRAAQEEIIAYQKTKEEKEAAREKKDKPN